MKIQVCSDLHLEFYKDTKFERVLERIVPQTDADVLIVAGDMGQALHVKRGLRILGERYPHVVYVAGNHEFYGSTRTAFNWDLCGELRPNVRYLDNQVAEIGGKRFVGTTLWFPVTPEATRNKKFMSDFSQIRDFGDWWREAHSEALAFLDQELRAGDILVTHHLPSRQSIAPRFEGNGLNCYFLGDIEPLIRDRQPALVAHGHTHLPMSYQLGSSLVACNPSGYPNENPKVQALLLEVP